MPKWTTSGSCLDAREVVVVAGTLDVVLSCRFVLVVRSVIQNGGDGR